MMTDDQVSQEGSHGAELINRGDNHILANVTTQMCCFEIKWELGISHKGGGDDRLTNQLGAVRSDTKDGHARIDGWKLLDIVHKPIPATTQFDDPAT